MPSKSLVANNPKTYDTKTLDNPIHISLIFQFLGWILEILEATTICKCMQTLKAKAKIHIII